MKCAQLLKGVNIVESFCNCNGDFNQSGVQNITIMPKSRRNTEVSWFTQPTGYMCYMQTTINSSELLMLD